MTFKEQLKQFDKLIKDKDVISSLFGIENMTEKQSKELALKALNIFNLSLDDHPRKIHEVFLKGKKYYENISSKENLHPSYFTFYRLFYLGNGIIRDLIDDKYGEEGIFRFGNTSCFG